MALPDGKILRHCWFCGRATLHNVFKTVKYFENVFDHTKGTYTFSRSYVCQTCKHSSRTA